jgi:flagellin-like protein
LFITNNTLNPSIKKIKLINSKKAVAPVIATLLLVAVAVVGGGINFTLSQQFFNSAQASGLSGIEYILFLGYDATDGDSLTYHDGLVSNPIDDWHGNQMVDGLKQGERIAIFVQNHSVHKVSFQELRLAGSVYDYQPMSPSYKMTSYLDNTLESGEYTIVKNGNTNAPADTISDPSPTIQPGQTVTIILELDKNIKIDRDMQFRIITTNGGAFVYTVLSGQQLD